MSAVDFSDQGRLNEQIRKALASEPISHVRAREFYHGLKRKIGNEKVQTNGKYFGRRVSIASLSESPRTIEYVVDVSDALVAEATKQDDRFKDIPVDLLQGLARAAFQLGAEANGYEGESS